MTGIRDEYAPTFGLQNLTLWDGALADVFTGTARELPNHDGFMVTLWPTCRKIRVECPAPRTDENFHDVDDAIRTAIKGV